MYKYLLLESIATKIMRGYHFNFGPSPFGLLYLVVLCISVRTLGDDACTKAFCGEGVCVLSSATIFGYDCMCNHGWSKFEIGLISCVLPNCTLDLTCGSRAPPPPPPPATPPPPFDLFSPCNFVWCNEGTCVVNGTGHDCQCNEGSSNLLGQSPLPCFKKCSFGLDCSDVLLGLAAPPPPPNGTLESPPRSPPNGSDKMLKRWSSGMVLLSTTILAWILY